MCQENKKVRTSEWNPASHRRRIIPQEADHPTGGGSSHRRRIIPQESGLLIIQQGDIVDKVIFFNKKTYKMRLKNNSLCDILNMYFLKNYM